MQEQTKCVPSVQQNKAIESTVQLSTVQLPSKTSRFLVQFRELNRVRATESGFMERAMGIEPTSEAWEASILPLYDARLRSNSTVPLEIATTVSLSSHHNVQNSRQA